MTRRFLVLRRWGLTLAVGLARRCGAEVAIERVTPRVPAAPALPAGHIAAPRPDVVQIVNLMVADESIGLVLQINRPGEPLRAIRFNGPGGRA